MIHPAAGIETDEIKKAQLLYERVSAEWQGGFQAPLKAPLICISPSYPC